MITTEAILNEVRSALRSEPRLDLQERPIALEMDNGDLIMDGEAADVAAKKRALRAAAKVPGVFGIIDRLHVVPAESMGDDAIREHVRDSLVQEDAFRDCTLFEIDKGKTLTVRDPIEGETGSITVAVAEGVVTLNGALQGLSQKRLAGVLAWWVPGSRDVVNGIAVEPPEPNRSGDLEDSVRIVLEKDPFINAEQTRIGVQGNVVRLTGLMTNETEREMAEYDAWYVFGVDDVVNMIEVRP